MTSRRSFISQSGAAAAAAAAAWITTRHGYARNLAQVTPPTLDLRNDFIAASWRISDAARQAGLELTSVRAAAAGELRGPFPVFRLTVDGAVLASGALPLQGPPQRQSLPRGGQSIAVHLADPDGRFEVVWRGLLPAGAHYLRQEITIVARNAPVALSDVELLSLPGDGARVVGSVAGSPIVVAGRPGEWFAGFEHPLSQAAAAAGFMRAALHRPLPLPAGQSVTYSSVIGAAPAGQTRRAFLAYLERERAHPYRPFQHYNSWFDLGYFTPYDEAGCLGVITAFGEELHRKRGVKLDSFLFDDGWDNHRDWGFNAGFPHGFSGLKAATARIGAAPGAWLSPWGGYGAPRRERLANAAAEGYETNRQGLALSGPVYYRRFHEICLEMVTTYGVNQFKFDGTGSAAQVAPGSAFGSDFEAAISLIGDLRVARPDLFINLTTGTYPSPFWLRYADSTWRGGDDTAFAGRGSDRQQWITYRDGDTWRGIVSRGPLYPLNSLMLHGIVYATHAARLANDPGGDFAAEARSYFGAGTQLQETYISHELLRPADWDTLAEAANWARRRAPILVDTHWIGGDPRALEPYGHAAWSPAGAALTLRNPSDLPQTMTLEIGAALELPPDAPDRWRLRSPWRQDQWGATRDRGWREFTAGVPQPVSLRPFEVLTLESL